MFRIDAGNTHIKFFFVIHNLNRYPNKMKCSYLNKIILFHVNNEQINRIYDQNDDDCVDLPDISMNNI
jgi:hypothetical protein